MENYDRRFWKSFWITLVGVDSGLDQF